MAGLAYLEIHRFKTTVRTEYFDKLSTGLVAAPVSLLFSEHALRQAQGERL
jgi:hypothetical protein